MSIEHEQSLNKLTTPRSDSAHVRPHATAGGMTATIAARSRIPLIPVTSTDGLDRAAINA